jgi:hypothetical protein
MFDSFYGKIEVAGNKDGTVRVGITNAAKPNFCGAWKNPEKKPP